MIPPRTYDAAGNPIQQHTLHNTYDAAGRLIEVYDTAQRERFPLGVKVKQGYDGLGQKVKQQEDNRSPVYYLRSTVLGGAVIAEINIAGQRLREYIYAGGEMIAKYENGAVQWMHTDPLTGGQRRTNSVGAAVGVQSEPDPVGIDMGRIDRYQLQMESQTGAELIYPKFGDALSTVIGCEDNGAPAACGGSVDTIRRGGSSLFSGVGRSSTWFGWVRDLGRASTFDLGFGTFYGGSLTELYERQHVFQMWKMPLLNAILDGTAYGRRIDSRSNLLLIFAPHRPASLVPQDFEQKVRWNELINQSFIDAGTVLLRDKNCRDLLNVSKGRISSLVNTLIKNSSTGNLAYATTAITTGRGESAKMYFGSIFFQ